MRATSTTAAPAGRDLQDFPTTHGAVALLNLDARIDGQRASSDTSLDNLAELVDDLILRGQFLGRIADYEQAAAIGYRLAKQYPAVAAARLVRARCDALFHKFQDALDEIDAAERLCGESMVEERAGVLQGMGRNEEALSIREAAARRNPGFESLAALAGLWADLGECDAAERFHAESLASYRGTSPFPPAILDFQIGVMRMRAGNLASARAAFKTALRRVPGFVPALGHLAEVRAELGQVEAAVITLREMAALSDDPDYAGQLARLLPVAGMPDEAACWRARAVERYDALVERHPEAFADHAAEFWLGSGDDPARAVGLARTNLACRETPRARSLLARAEQLNSPSIHPRRHNNDG